MALTRTNILSEQSATSIGAGSFTTSSQTIPAGEFLVVIGRGVGSNPASATNLTISDSKGNVYTSRMTLDASGWGGTEDGSIRVWTAPVTASGAATWTIDAGADSYGQIAVTVLSYAGADTTGIGATASNSNAGTDGALTLTLSGAPATTSDVIGFLLIDINTGLPTSTPGAGFTELYNVGTSGWTISEVQARSGSASTSVPWVDINDSVDSAFASMAIAFEIRAAAGAAAGVVWDPGQGARLWHPKAPGSFMRAIQWGAAAISAADINVVASCGVAVAPSDTITTSLTAISTEAVAVAESGTVTRGETAVSTEGVSVAETATVTRDLTGLATEGVSVAEIGVVTIDYGPSVATEGVSVAETGTATVSRTALATEAVGVAETAAFTPSVTAVATEGVAIAESAIATTSITAAASEGVAVAETATATHQLTGLATEGVAVSPTGTVTTDRTTIATEGVAVGGQGTFSTGSDISVVASCGVGVASTATATLGLTTTATEGVSCASSATVTASRTAIATEGVGTSSSGTATVNRTTISTESVAVSATAAVTIAGTDIDVFASVRCGVSPTATAQIGVTSVARCHVSVQPCRRVTRTSKGGAKRGPAHTGKLPKPRPSKVIKIGYDEIAPDTALVDIYAGEPGPEVEPFARVDSDSDILLMLF